MIVAIIVGVVLFLLTALLHYVALQWLGRTLNQTAHVSLSRWSTCVLAVLSTHLVGVGLYAVGFAFAAEIVQIGVFGGMPVETALDYFYFSFVTYTSLGLGDVFPEGHLRFLTGVEALNGLLLLAWSGAFLFSAMSRGSEARRT